MTMTFTEGIALPAGRRPQRGELHGLPPGSTIVSADSHWSVRDDIWFEGFPSSMKHLAPRVWERDGVWHIGVDGRSFFSEATHEALKLFEGVDGCTLLDARLRDLTTEGIDQEIVFGNGVLVFLNASAASPEVRELVWRIYNEHLADLGRRAPGRFHGVPSPVYWDMSKVEASIQHIVDLGFTSVALPQHPGVDPEGRELRYLHTEMEPLWRAIADADLTTCFHIGEGSFGGPGGRSASALINFGPLRRPFGELVFGGVLDRHPDLRVVFVEAGMSWVPPMLQDAEMIFDCHREIASPKLEHRPTHYWQRNCYATFISDPVGFRILDLIGADRVMWGHDYPHSEGALGWSWSAMQSIIDATSPEVARAILGATATKVFKLD